MRISKKLVAVGVAVGTLAVAGVSYAYWTANGEGDASATAYTAEVAEVTAVVDPAADGGLWPGADAVAVHFTVDNPNPYPVQYTDFLNASVSAVSGPVGDDCGIGDFAVLETGLLDAAVDVPAGNTVGVAGSATVLTMDSDADDDCQGVTVTVDLDVKGLQVDAP